MAEAQACTSAQLCPCHVPQFPQLKPGADSDPRWPPGPKALSWGDGSCLQRLVSANGNRPQDELEGCPDDSPQQTWMVGDSVEPEVSIFPWVHWGASW